MVIVFIEPKINELCLQLMQHFSPLTAFGECILGLPLFTIASLLFRIISLSSVLGALGLQAPPR